MAMIDGRSGRVGSGDGRGEGGDDRGEGGRWVGGDSGTARRFMIDGHEGRPCGRHAAHPRDQPGSSTIAKPSHAGQGVW